jgi:hypothetical protein
MCFYIYFTTASTNLNERNVVAEWLALLLHIRDVPGSNLGPKTEYSESFHSFPNYVQANSGTITLKLSHDHFLPNPLLFAIHIKPYHSTLYSLSH